MSTPEGRRALAIASPVFFDTYYCGMRYATHRESWLARIDDLRKDAKKRRRKTRLLHLAPRDHGKTELAITVAARAVCMDRNIRILWISEASGAAEKRLRRVKAVLDSPRVREDWCSAPAEGYGPFVVNEGTDKWTDRLIQVSRTLASVDPTIEAVGSGGQVTGGHFDLILCDDLEDDRTTYSANERKKGRDWFFGTVGPMLSPGGQMYVIGTRKHHDDLYAHLKESKSWSVIEDPAVIKWPESYTYNYSTDHTGKEIVESVTIIGEAKVLWPEERGIEYLLLEKLSNTSRMFAREWQHQVQDDSSAQVKWEWIEKALERGRDMSLYKLPPGMKLNLAQGWDLSLATDARKAEEHDTDYSVGITWGRAPNGDRYLCGIARRRGMTPAQLRGFVTGEYRRFKGRVSTVRVEKNAFGEIHYLGLQSETDLPLKPHMTTGPGKADPWEGIPALAALFENGKVIIPSRTEADREAVEPLLQELWGLGKEKHDDTVIALWISEIAVRDEAFQYQVAFGDADFDEVPADARKRLQIVQGGGGRKAAERAIQREAAWEGLDVDFGED